MRKKILSIVISFAVALSVIPMAGNMAFAENTDYVIGNPVWNTGNTVATWDCIYFGNYYNSIGSRTNGEKAPIKWRVLNVNGNEALLLADKNIDGGVNYNDQNSNVTWANSTIRAWVNGAFYGAAFLPLEQNAIIQKTIVNSNNPTYSTAGGNNTSDKVFLLSIEEASKNAYGFSADSTRIAANSEYTKGNIQMDGSSWWLRSPGMYSNRAAIVDSAGKIQTGGKAVSPSGQAYGIRPALYINLKTADWTYAGKVSSDGSFWEPVENYSLELSSSSFTYDGKLKKPSVTVGSLKNGTDYTVAYTGNKYCGKAKVTVTGIGNYKGTITEYFTITPAKAKLSKVTAGSKKINVAIKSQKSSKVSGYQIYYKKSGSAAKTCNTSSTSKTLKSLSKGKKYTVKVRAYVKIGDKKYYGAYSTAKTVKVK